MWRNSPVFRRAAIERARELLATLEVREGDAAAKAAAIPSAPATPPALTRCRCSRSSCRIPPSKNSGSLDLDAMTPLEAFDRLRALAAKTRGAGDA